MFGSKPAAAIGVPNYTPGVPAAAACYPLGKRFQEVRGCQRYSFDIISIWIRRHSLRQPADRDPAGLLNRQPFALPTTLLLCANSLDTAFCGQHISPRLSAVRSIARTQFMIDALRRLRVTRGPGTSLFLFATREELCGVDPMMHSWHDGDGRAVRLI
jgi:hypothetical protein